MQSFKDQVFLLFSNKELFDKAINYPREKLSEMIFETRREQLSKASQKLQKALISKGRCPKCTLPTPCRHMHELLHIPSLSPMESIRASSRTPEINYSLHLIEAYKEPEKVKKRLKVMENLHNFKEAKLKCEIQKIEEKKKLEKSERVRQKSEELKRQKYFELQKKRLKEYKDKKIISDSEEVQTSSRRTWRVLKANRLAAGLEKFKNKMEEIDTMLETQMSFIA